MSNFDHILEGHRAQIARLRQHVLRTADERLLEAVQFLLALAHQPTPGGVVDIVGSSPADGVHREHRVDGTHREHRVMPANDPAECAAADFLLRHNLSAAYHRSLTGVIRTEILRASVKPAEVEADQRREAELIDALFSLVDGLLSEASAPEDETLDERHARAMKLCLKHGAVKTETLDRIYARLVHDRAGAPEATTPQPKAPEPNEGELLSQAIALIREQRSMLARMTSASIKRGFGLVDALTDPADPRAVAPPAYIGEHAQPIRPVPVSPAPKPKPEPERTNQPAIHITREDAKSTPLPDLETKTFVWVDLNTYNEQLAAWQEDEQRLGFAIELHKSDVVKDAEGNIHRMDVTYRKTLKSSD